MCGIKLSSMFHSVLGSQHFDSRFSIFGKVPHKIIHICTLCMQRGRCHILWEVRQKEKECSKWQPNEFDFKWCVTALAWYRITGEIFGRRLIPVAHCNTHIHHEHTIWRCNMQRCTRFTRNFICLWFFASLEMYVFFPCLVRFSFLSYSTFDFFHLLLILRFLFLFSLKINIYFCQLF